MKIDEIKCPKCDMLQEFDDGYEGLVTYWGEDGYPVEIWCSNCDHIFKVQEQVIRTYEYK